NGSRPTSGSAGSGSVNAASPRPELARLLSAPPCTDTKLGQKPSTQEKSLLQDDWLILRFLPNSVSTGSTDTQLEVLEQSPQPSHTSSLMNARFGGSTISPRFLRRRFSAAQVWS